MIDLIFPLIVGLIFIFFYLFKFPFKNILIENKFNFTRALIFYTITPLIILQVTISKYFLNEEYIKSLFIFIVIIILIFLLNFITIKFMKVKLSNQLY